MISLSQRKDLSRYKLYLADNGIFVSILLKTGAYTDEVLYSKLLSDKLPANLGYLYENAVATSLAASGRDLYYMAWNKKDSTHSFEVDFLLSKGNKISPVEVKSSRIDMHGSIDEFTRKFSSAVISPRILSQKDIAAKSGIVNYPFYLSSFLFEK